MQSKTSLTFSLFNYIIFFFASRLVHYYNRFNVIVLIFWKMRFMLLGLRYIISESNKRIFSGVYEVRKGTPSICISLQHSIALTGDIRVEFFNRPKMKPKVHILMLYHSFLIR